MQTILRNARVFTGHGWETGLQVVLDNGLIAALEEEHIPHENASHIDCSGHLLVPAFTDLQIYGAGGKLFSQQPGTEALQTLAKSNLQGGTAHCLVTIATQPPPVIYACIDAIRSYWQQGGKGIMGMHLEGPFMNPAKRGAHVEAWIHTPTLEEVEALLAHSNGVIKMVTLAPEVCSRPVVDLFNRHGVVVSAGHSAATYPQAMQAFDNGIRTITHLYNAMSGLQHREPGLVGAAFNHPDVRASIIPDGMHVDYAALKIAKKMMGARLFFITDAVTETAAGPYLHELRGDRYTVADGTLSGSAITMLQGIRNAVEHAGITLQEAIRMATLYPAQVMRMDDIWGKIAPGYEASLLLIDEDLQLQQVFVPYD